MTEQKVTKKKGAGHLPVKRSVNLAQVGVEQVSLRTALPGVLIVLVLVALFSKFGVADRLTALTRAESAAAEVRSKVDAGYALIDQYAGVDEEYAHYTLSGMTAEELAQADRAEVVSLIQRVILPAGIANSWNLNGNELSLTVTGSSLQEINLLARSLEQEPLVSFCTVTQAETVEIDVEDVVVPAVPAEGEPAEDAAETEEAPALETVVHKETVVKASIIIYLTGETEAAQ